jgi:hypothetical protein
MVDPTKRRQEILHEITQLGKLQREAIEKASSKNESPVKSGAYEERGRRIAQLVSELVSLGEVDMK